MNILYYSVLLQFLNYGHLYGSFQEVFVKIEYIIWRVFNETIVEKYARNIIENLIYFHT